MALSVCRLMLLYCPALTDTACFLPLIKSAAHFPAGHHCQVRPERCWSEVWDEHEAPQAHHLWHDHPVSGGHQNRARPICGAGPGDSTRGTQRLRCAQGAGARDRGGGRACWPGGSVTPEGELIWWKQGCARGRWPAGPHKAAWTPTSLVAALYLKATQLWGKLAHPVGPDEYAMQARQG